MVCTRVAYSNNIPLRTQQSLRRNSRSLTSTHRLQKKAWRAEARLQGKLQANRGCVTLQRRGCRSNSGLEIRRRTRSFPERTSSAGSVAAILWQLETFVCRKSCRHLEPVFGGKRALEARAAQKTQDTKNALFGVRRFQRFLLQKRSGDEAVTSLVTSVFWTKFGCFEAFLAQKSQKVGYRHYYSWRGAK